MICVYCSVGEQYVNPLFELFDGGDFVLSSYAEAGDRTAEMRIFLPGVEGEDAKETAAAKDALRRALDAAGASAEIMVRTVPDEDWTLSYRAHFRTTVISPRLAIVPEWEDFAPAPGQKVLKIDPGMAFGTGNHETTRSCLEYIAESGAHGDFLDIGCGSGILAIAAKLLGSGRVRGFDLDPDAVRIAAESAEKNGADARFFNGDLSDPRTVELAGGPAEFAVANVLAPVLERFAPQVAALVAPGGSIVLSGILCEQYDDVKAAYCALGFREISSKVSGEWKTGLFAAPGDRGGNAID